MKAASAALIGAGGLGAPTALYLAAAGVGRLRIIDPDAASLSNLQRQIIYRSADVGRSKVERAAEALAALNENVVVEPIAERLDDGNAARLITGCDLVLDGCDDFGTRFAVNAAAH
ncbi:MAG: ThiF family adenylyltransferase, partial [Alphaproteobacteria bacterium]